MSRDASWSQVLLFQGQEKALNVILANLPDVLDLFPLQMVEEPSQPVSISLDRILRKALFNDEVMEKLIQVLVHDVARKKGISVTNPVHTRRLEPELCIPKNRDPESGSG